MIISLSSHFFYVIRISLSFFRIEDKIIPLLKQGRDESTSLHLTDDAMHYTQKETINLTYLANRDYSEDGYYFTTICASDRESKRSGLILDIPINTSVTIEEDFFYLHL